MKHVQTPHFPQQLVHAPQALNKQLLTVRGRDCPCKTCNFCFSAQLEQEPSWICPSTCFFPQKIIPKSPSGTFRVRCTDPIGNLPGHVSQMVQSMQLHSLLENRMIPGLNSANPYSLKRALVKSTKLFWWAQSMKGEGQERDLYSVSRGGIS